MNKGAEFKGEWVFNPEDLVLWYFSERGDKLTEIDIERIKKPIDMLGWMAHYLEKGWAHREKGCMLALLEAFDYVFNGLEGIEDRDARYWTAVRKGARNRKWRFFPKPAFDTRGPDVQPGTLSPISANVLMKLVDEYEEVWAQVSTERCRKAGFIK